MDPSLYFTAFIFGVTILCAFLSARFLTSPDFRFQEKGVDNKFVALILSVFLIYWLGMRPINIAFGDTVSYSRIYMLMEDGENAQFDLHSEWVWEWIMQTCHKAGLSVNVFFTIIEGGYILSAFFAVCILMPKNILMGMLFVFASFSFFTFGVNGLRNGIAVHIVLLGIALYFVDYRLLACALFLTAAGIHRSSMLPIACFFCSTYIIKDPKTSIIIWLGSIIVSLFAGQLFVGFFSGLGIDERVNMYMNTEGNVLENATSKFRWDFLLYSSMPVLLAWNVIIKKGVTDSWYNILVSTYCLANAFWILVIRASFTNRFAYLSWFLYPIIVAYPLIMLPVWEDQDNKIGVLLMAYIILTLGISYFTHML